MSVTGVLQGSVVTFPRGVDDQTTTPRITVSAQERAAIERCFTKLPRWAVDLGLTVESTHGEAQFTTVIRALAAGMYDAEPPVWLTPQLLQLDIEVRRHALSLSQKLSVLCLCRISTAAPRLYLLGHRFLPDR